MKIVIVGGGAGGLELATKLGRKMGRRGKADVLLIDRQQTHIWKPLLHEVAAGSLDDAVDAVSYRVHAHKHGFAFQLGTLCDIDRGKKRIELCALGDEQGNELLPERFINYDILVLAIGSVSNDFGVEGISQHCTFLDCPDQARQFHRQLVNQFMRLNQLIEQDPNQKLSIAIVGGGATGVELAAELFNARQWFSLYGLHNVDLGHFNVTLIEAGPRILGNLSERISGTVQKTLLGLGLEIRCNTQVKKAEAGALHTADGDCIEAHLTVWAAGIKAPEFLKNFGELKTNKLNQIVVNEYLQPEQDSSIYVLGDCAGRALGENGWVPPRAQSAHQMASSIYQNLRRVLAGKTQRAFVYKDHGSLIFLSRFTAVGSLMGNFSKGNVNLEGWLARQAYMSLYRMHQFALHGGWRTLVMLVAEKIHHITRPRLKVH